MRALTTAACALLAAGLVPAPAAAADLILSARAGLDGVTRPGRWAPVVVTVENRSQPLTGDLIVEWGEARVRQAVELPAPSTKRVTLFIRTGDVRESMSVRVEADGEQITSIDVPVRIAPADAHVLLCIGDPGGGGADAARCTVSLPAAAIPASARAFDAADEVDSGTGTDLSGAHVDALALWSAARRVEAAGNAAPATGARPEPAPRSRYARETIGIYAALLGSIVIAFPYVRRRRLLYPALAATIVSGTVVAAAAGRTRPVVIHHTSIAEEFAGINGAVVTMRGTAEYPAALGPVAADACDGAVNVGGAGGPTLEQRSNLAGCPLVYGESAVGSARSFTVDTIAPFHALDFVPTPGGGRLVNVSGQKLHACDLPDGLGQGRIDTFEPGDHVDGPASWPLADPVVSCRLDAAPLMFHHPTTDVVARGTTIVVLHLPAHSTAPATSP